MNLFHSTLGLNIPVNGLLPGSTKKETKGKKKSFFKMKHFPLSLMDSTSDVQMFIHYPWSCSKTFPLLQDVTTGWFNNRPPHPHPTTCRMEQTGAALSKKGFEMLLGSGEWFTSGTSQHQGSKWNSSVRWSVNQQEVMLRHLSSECHDCFWLVPLER